MTFLRVGEVARQLNVSSSAVRKYCDQGLLNPERTPHGQRVFTQEEVNRFLGISLNAPHRVYYARTSAQRPTERANQITRLTQAYGEPDKVFKDYGSGLNENRRGLWAMIAYLNEHPGATVHVTSKDRLTRFGYTYLAHYFETFSTTIIVLDNERDVTLEEELMQDFMSLIASFAGRFHRLRGYRQQRLLLQQAEENLKERENAI